MKQLLVILTVLSGLSYANAQVVSAGRVLTSPSQTLSENDCVFKNKGVPSLMDYGFIVDKCDRRVTPLLMLFSDHLPQGACVYNVVQKMSGHTIARIVEKCPSIEAQEIQGIVPDAPLEEIQQDENEDHMPQIPGQQHVKKAAAAKPKAKPQQVNGNANPTDQLSVLRLKAQTLDQDAVAAEATLVQAQKDYDTEKAKGAAADKNKLTKLANDLEDVRAIARNARESANIAKAEYQEAAKKDQVKPKTNEQVEKGNQGYYINPNEIEF